MPEESTRPYVFISYGSADRERVLPIVAALTNAGIRVWRDQDDIAGGTSYGPAIATAIRGSAAVLILCSDASLTSRNVRQEMAIAWKHDKPYLPLLLDPVTTLPEEVEYWLEGAQWIEVLAHPREVWLPRVTDALSRIASDFKQLQPTAQSLPTEERDPAARPPTLSALPTPLTELVGRQAEIEQIIRLLSASRLVTLIGPGGTGKTRLALEVGHRADEQFADGVVWIDLSPLRDPGLAMSTLATTLGVLTVSHEPILTTLIRAIGTRHLLLVTDNWEQIIEAAADLGSLLRACPHLHVLATSRVALRISGEREMPIEPLTVPDDHDGAVEPDLEGLRQNDAVRLFVDRAIAVKPGFALTAENAPAVVGICRGVDGLPLAIELAAARVKVLPPQAILQRMEHSLSLLTGGARDVAERQQAMRNTIRWSFDLLTPDEQRLMRRLSVFVGGWTLEGAEAVTDIDGDLGIDVLDGLLSLVEKSLVIQHERADGTMRYRLLVPIREFAGEQLDQHRETVALRQRHARAIRDLVQWDFEYLQELDYDWLDRVGAEHDNVRAALTWASESDDIDLGIEIAGQLGWYWYFKGNLRDGAEWTSAFLARYPLRDQRRGRALIGLSIVRTGLGDYDAAERAAEEAVAIGREVNDVALVTEGLLLRAVAMTNSHQRDDADIEADYAEAFRLANANTFDWCMANTLRAWADFDVRVGRYDRAEESFHRSLAIVGTVGTRSLAWCGLGRIAALRGDDDAAIGHCREALLVNRSAFHRPSVIDTLELLATVLLRNGQAEIAAQLLSVTDRDRRLRGFKQGVGVFPDIVSEETFRQHLDPAAFAEAWRAGAAMSLEDGVAVALEATEE